MEPEGCNLPAESDDRVEQYRHYAQAARGTATKSKTMGDHYGEQLASARAAVYDAAADMLKQMPAQEAAGRMMQRAGQLHVRTPPLMEFDQAGVRYVQSRAWQYCALEIDRTLEEQASSWQ